jgi:hypothetical protein
MYYIIAFLYLGHLVRLVLPVLLVHLDRLDRRGRQDVLLVGGVSVCGVQACQLGHRVLLNETKYYNYYIFI